MDANKMEFIEERNGFVIRGNKDDNIFPHYIFHPNFDGIYLDAYMTLEEAEEFCDEEDANQWAEDIRNGLV